MSKRQPLYQHILKVLSLSLLLLLPVKVLAQANQLKESLFKEIQTELFIPQKTTKITFSSRSFSSDGAEMSYTQGSIYLDGEQFRLEYKPIIAVYSQKLLTYHNSEDESLTISQPSQEELIQINPFYFLLSGAKGFRLIKQKEKQGLLWLYFLAENEEMNLKQLAMAISPKKQVQKVEIQAVDGTLFRLEVRSQEYIEQKAQSFYQLKRSDYPKSEYIDLR